MWIIIINYLFSLIGGVLILQLLKVKYGLRFRNKEYFAFIITVMLAVGSILTFWGPNEADKTLLFVGIHILFIRIYGRAKWRPAIVGVLSYYIATAVGEFLAYIMLVRVLGIPPGSIRLNPILHSLAYLFDFSLVMGLIAYYRTCEKNYEYQYDIRETGEDRWLTTWLLFILLLIIVAFMWLTRNEFSQNSLLTINVLILGGFFVVCIGFMMITHQLILKKNENSHLKLYVDTINSLSYDLRRFRHNYRNILQALLGFIQYKQWEALEEYVREVAVGATEMFDISSISLDRIHDCGLYGLLLGKVCEATSRGVLIHINSIGETDELAIQTVDLCTVMGVFIDNAMEAVAGVAKGIVTIDIVTENAWTVITVENPYNSEPADTVRNAKRGNGLSYVRDILQGYPHILWNTSMQEKIYIQEIQIPHSVR